MEVMLDNIGIFKRMEGTNTSATNIDSDEDIDSDERVIGLEEYRVAAVVDTCYGCQHDDSC